jgi:hypothetical protein
LRRPVELAVTSYLLGSYRIATTPEPTSSRIATHLDLTDRL